MGVNDLPKAVSATAGWQSIQRPRNRPDHTTAPHLTLMYHYFTIHSFEEDSKADHPRMRAFSYAWTRGHFRSRDKDYL